MALPEKMPFTIEFPRDIPFSKLWPGFLVLAVLASVFLFEILRRRRQQNDMRKKEWNAVHDLAHERELPAADIRLLDKLLRRYAAHEPLRAVTMYKTFDTCVARYMRDYAHGRSQDLEERLGAELRSIRVRLGLDYVPFGHAIESTRELCSGQTLWAARDNEMSATWFRMRVATVDEARFSADIGHDDPVPTFHAGEMARFRIWREEDARYVFLASLARIETAPPLWIFAHASELKRIQARAHYRVRHDQNAAIGVIPSRPNDTYDDVGNRELITSTRGRITSLSGGGFALVIEQPIPQQVVLRTALELPGEQQLPVHARIVSSSPLSQGRYLLRAAFVSIPEETRDAITHYVFHIQQARGVEAQAKAGEPAE